MRVLVTGASTGIGRFLLSHLANQDHEVWGVARNLPEVQLDGSGQFFTQADVSSIDQVRDLVAIIEQRWPCVDAVICCAAIHGPIGPLIGADPSAWKQAIDVNLFGFVNIVQQTYPLLRRSLGQRKIIGFSGGGATSSRANFSAYAASKTAVVRTIEVLADEIGSEGFDVNCIAPGAIKTRLIDEVLALPEHVVGAKESNSVRKLDFSDQSKSLGKVADLVDFLLSNESNGIKGRLISALWDNWRQFKSHKRDIEEQELFTLRRLCPADRGLNWS